MNITDTVQRLADEIRDGKIADEIVDSFINTADYTTHTAILDELGDCDLSEPPPDLSAGWPQVRAQLAHNALYRAVLADIDESEG